MNQFVRDIAAFDRLPYFNVITDVAPELMHMIARIGLQIIKTLMCADPIDSVKVRFQEKSLGHFHEACQIEDDVDAPLPHAPQFLTQEELQLADDRHAGVLAPIGFGFRPAVLMFCVQENMKSYDWFQVTRWFTLLLYCRLWAVPFYFL